jgi:hypothetical protein
LRIRLEASRITGKGARNAGPYSACPDTDGLSTRLVMPTNGLNLVTIKAATQVKAGYSKEAGEV